LYDLQKDPFELNNLAGHEGMRDTLLHLRKILKDWMEETNDLGRIPESDLIAKWLPEGKQPKLAPLQMQETDSGIELISLKSDATLVWKQPQDSIWNVYSKPLSQNSSFEAKAERIGYLDSEVLEYQKD